jgi:hypothetical protein
MSVPLPEDARQMAVSFMTTEHFALQGSRGMTISESNGRAGLFLSSLSSALVALGFAATASSFGQSFSVFALLILPPIAFLGFVTFQRTVQSGVDDEMYSRGINRIRRFYLEMVPELGPYLIPPAPEGGITAVVIHGKRAQHWQSFLTIASVVGVMNSVVIGGIVGIAVDLLAEPDLPVTLAIGVVVALITATFHASYQSRQWRSSFGSFSAMFPQDGSNGGA